MDRISSLPTELICHIGSFLSAKEAAFAMVLSKRWRNLFPIVPELHLDADRESFKDFADLVLALPANSRVRSFTLMGGFKGTENAHINRVLCHVLKRGVMNLTLDLYEDGYSLPVELFTCKTVAKLRLGFGFEIKFIPANAYLPALKSLYLDKIRFYESGRCAFHTLLAACPVLEELTINGVEFERWKWSFNVSSPTLQRLTIKREEWDCDLINGGLDSRGLAYDFDSLIFDTPALTYLHYFDYVPKEYPLVNLNSLVEANLDLRADHDRVWGERHADDFNPMNLINGLKNVEILSLSVETLQMFYVFREALPVFENLLSISVTLCDLCWIALSVLLKKSPNVKTLIIQNLFHSFENEHGYVCGVSEYSFLSSCRIEVLKITRYYGSIRELEKMKLLLEKLSFLKTVEFHYVVSGGDFMVDLSNLPRASTDCKFQVKPWF